jgi:hypothetical protein
MIRITLFGIEETRADAQRTSAAIVTLAAGTLRPALVDIRSMHMLTRDVRTYSMETQDIHMVSAAALLVRSPLSRMIGNIIMKIFAPAGIPLRLFTAEDNAMTWLKGFVT